MDRLKATDTKTKSVLISKNHWHTRISQMHIPKSKAWLSKVLSTEIKVRFYKPLLGLPAPRVTHKNEIFKKGFWHTDLLYQYGHRSCCLKWHTSENLSHRRFTITEQSAANFRLACCIYLVCWRDPFSGNNSKAVTARQCSTPLSLLSLQLCWILPLPNAPLSSTIRPCERRHLKKICREGRAEKLLGGENSQEHWSELTFIPTSTICLAEEDMFINK